MNTRLSIIISFVFVGILGLRAQALPVDPAIKTGKLSNGLTYYICPNTQPKGLADFYLVTNAGAVVEEDAENGMAHFLEHMAFNGTRHFEGRRLMNYLESVGVKFGENLNATTYRDKTVYRISDVLLADNDVVDNCLLILRDWIDGISMEDETIDKEKLVIREELRLRNTPDFRINQSFYNQLMPGSQYTERNVIGTEEVIMNLTPQKLKDFYRKWSRPDLAAVIVAGDVSGQEIEQKIESMFASLTMPDNAPERSYIRTGLEENDKPLVAVAVEKEIPYSTVMMEYLHPSVEKEKRGSVDEIVMDYIHLMGVKMFYNRLAECEEQFLSTLLQPDAGDDTFMGLVTLKSFWGGTIVKDDEFESHTKSLFRETERIRRFGFTNYEYELAKQEVLALVESQVNNRNNSSNVERCIEHFITNAYMTDAKTEYGVYESLSSQLPLEAINEYYADLLSAENRVLKIATSQTDTSLLPTQNQCMKWLTEVEDEELTAYEKKGIHKPLLAEVPSGGEIVSEMYDQQFDATLLTLSNGVKIVLKKTDFQKDQIEMKATSLGGSSHFPENNPVNIALYEELSDVGGLGEFSYKDLKLILAGKNAEVTPFINTISEGFTGSSNVRDFEVMLQLLYLHFTSPRMDYDAYKLAIARKKILLESQKKELFSVVSDSLRSTVFENQARHYSLTPDDLMKADYHTIMEWRKERYADASDFTFVFSGDISVEQAKALVVRYLGTLPALNRNESFKEINDDYRSGHICNVFSREMEEPKCISVNIYSAMLNYNMSDIIKADMLALILKNVYTEKIRRENGSVYSISSEAIMEDYPLGLLQLQVNFICEPGKEDGINQIIHQEFVKIAQEGPETEQLVRVKEFMLKKQHAREQENDYWAQTLADYYMIGHNTYSNYTNLLNNLSTSDLKEMASYILEKENRIEVTLTHN